MENLDSEAAAAGITVNTAIGPTIMKSAAGGKGTAYEAGQDLLLYAAGLPVALLFFIMGITHLAHPEIFDGMVPHFFPFPRGCVYITGLLMILGSLAMCALPLIDTAAMKKCIFAMLALVVVMAPANIYVFYYDLPVFGHKLDYSWSGHGLHLLGLIVLGLWLAALARAYSQRPPLVESIFRQLQHLRRPSMQWASSDVFNALQPLEVAISNNSRSS